LDIGSKKSLSRCQKSQRQKLTRPRERKGGKEKGKEKVSGTVY
jgi:hypothetical protein